MKKIMTKTVAIILILLMACISLSSCGSQTITGTYKGQMTTEKGDLINFTLAINDDSSFIFNYKNLNAEWGFGNVVGSYRVDTSNSKIYFRPQSTLQELAFAEKNLTSNGEIAFIYGNNHVMTDTGVYMSKEK